MTMTTTETIGGAMSEVTNHSQLGVATVLDIDHHIDPATVSAATAHAQASRPEMPAVLEVPEDRIAQLEVPMDRAPQRVAGLAVEKRWTCRISAVSSHESASWAPSEQVYLQAARSAASLRCEEHRYDLEFAVLAVDLGLATRATMGMWARLYERCPLPEWPLVSVTVEQVDPTPPATAVRDHRQSRPVRPRRRRQALPSPRQTTLSGVTEMGLS